MKIATPNALLISAALLALAILFRVDEMSYIDAAKADVAGMSYYELERDYDFKRAVESIVEAKIDRYDHDFKSAVHAVVEKCKIRDPERRYLYTGDLDC